MTGVRSQQHVGFGVVEGFYGPPWSLAARLDMIRFLSTIGLDTYAYAPKSDPSHRDQWWRPLTVHELEQFEALACAARAASVRFAYGIAPQRLFGAKKNLLVTSERDLDGDAFTALVRRCESVAARGVDDFFVSFDDTWATLAPRLASAAQGRAHALIAARLADRLRGLGRAPRVAVVPAVYFGRAEELAAGALAYLRGLTASGEMPVAWTGPRIFSPYISAGDLRALCARSGLSIWIWNNAITNDWLPLTTGELVGLRGRQRLSFGPVRNLGPDVAAGASGVLLNAAREAEVTKVGLFSMAEQLRFGRAYDPDAAVQQGLDLVFGEAARHVRPLFDVVRGHPLSSPTVAEAPFFEAMVARARWGDRGARSDLDAYLESLLDLEVNLARSLAGRPAEDELRPTAKKIVAAARALRASMKGSPRASQLAVEASRIPWSTGLDGALALAQKRRFL